MPQQRDELIPTRASLIGRLKRETGQTSRYEASWQEFFDIYWKLIYGVARKAGLIDAEAQDVVQEVMASVAKHMPTFKYDPAIGSFKTWLLNMTRWRINGQFRKRGRFIEQRPSCEDTSTGTDVVQKVADPAGPEIDAEWEMEWKKNLFDAAKAKVKLRIDPQKYQIFDFNVNQEWAAEKVAARFNVSVDQVYVIKSRVTEKIREEVKRLEKEMT